VERYTQTAEDPAFAEEEWDPNKPIRVRNGDMTKGNEKPESWDTQWGEVRVFRDMKVFKSEPASFCVETVKAGVQGNGGQTLEIEAGASGKFSGWMKTEGKVKVNVALMCFTDDWKMKEFKQLAYRHDNAASDWSEWTAEATVPEGTGHVQLVLLVEGDGKAWLDDVKVGK
jgi:hypothetical protein